MNVRIFSRKLRFIAGFLSSITMSTPLAYAISAFPGAQGGGAVSIGGRGGRIIEVTTLADSGPGSLRACALASGPRICVFKVAGDIKLQSVIYIMNPYLTVAGQTAPGGGIQISGVTSTQNLIGIDTHDVIWQYTKIRKGFNPNLAGEFIAGANLTIDGASYNVIVDHNSVQWNQDEGLSVWSGPVPAKNITFSNNLVAEGLYPHSTGYLTGATTSAVSSQMTDIDFYNNLTMNNSHRNPLLTNKSSRVINNLFYNYAYYAVQAGPGVNLDLIGNKFKFGPMNATTVRELQLYGSGHSVYIANNIGYFQPNKSGEQWQMVSQVAGQNATDYGTPAPLSSRRFSKLPATQYPITITDVDNIEAIILPQAGASRRLGCDGNWVSNRDSVDLRLVTQYTNDSGIRTIPRDQAEVGGFPVIAAGTPCADADHDGMPDQWEVARGLNPNNAADANSDRNSDGYTNIEEYLAGNATAPAPAPTPEPTPEPTPTPTPTPVGISNLVASNDATNVTYSFSFSGTPGFLRVFLDTDKNATTGFAVQGIGADYMIENDNLYKHSGVGTGWTFSLNGSSNMVKSVSSVKFTLARVSLGSPASINLIGNADNNAYSAIINQTITDPVATIAISNMVASNDATNVSYSFSFSGAPGFLRVYIDTDKNAGTGFAVKGIGADYMIENENLYKHSGVGTGWTFSSAGSSNMVKSVSSVKFTVSRLSLGSPASANVIGNADNSAYSAIINQTISNPVSVETKINMASVAKDSGYSYIIYQTFPTAGDNSIYPRQSQLQIYENGKALGPAHSLHTDIRSLGKGRFSHWGNSLRFSASDNTNPKRNGRVYTYRILSSPAP